jgi:ABC-2 type transport system permease protein
LALSAFHSLAHTDLQSHLRYLDSVHEYHDRLKQFFFPVIFARRTVGEVDWSAAPAHRFADDSFPREALSPLRTLVVVALVMAAAAMLSIVRLGRTARHG